LPISGQACSPIWGFPIKEWERLGSEPFVMAGLVPAVPVVEA
jgi:hypothetical protein